MKRSVLALGMFDGMHLGHQALLKEAKALAIRSQAALVVCTFATHPMQLIMPCKSPLMLTTWTERIRLMRIIGADVVYAPVFDDHMMNLSPEAYIASLCARFNPCFVVAGYNYSFGKAGCGTPSTLAALGELYEYQTCITPQIALDGQETSSTAIRVLLSGGEVLKAMRLLGRPYSRQATLQSGEGGVVTLSFACDGKQSMPLGCYRVILTRNKRHLPATLHLRQEDGRSVLSLGCVPFTGKTEVLFVAGERQLDLS